MGNTHSFTTKYVAIKEALEHVTRPLRSHAAKKAARERGATFPNSLEPLPRSLKQKQLGGKA